MGVLKWTESLVEGAVLLEEFKLLGGLLPARQCKFPCPTTALINKNASPYFVLVTRRSQSSQFYRPRKLRQESCEGTCLWPYITVWPVTCSRYCPRQSKPERSHCSMPGQSWEMLLDASCCGQLGVWAQQKRSLCSPACPPLLTGGRDLAWLGSSAFQVLLHHMQDMLLAIYFTAAPSGIKYSCLNNGNRCKQLNGSCFQPAIRWTVLSGLYDHPKKGCRRGCELKWVQSCSRLSACCRPQAHPESWELLLRHKCAAQVVQPGRKRGRIWSYSAGLGCATSDSKQACPGSLERDPACPGGSAGVPSPTGGVTNLGGHTVTWGGAEVKLELRRQRCSCH